MDVVVNGAAGRCRAVLASALLVPALLGACATGGWPIEGMHVAVSPDPHPDEPSAAAAAMPVALVSRQATSTCELHNFRTELLRAVNEVRARGAECGSHGRFGAASPLVWNDALALAADEHSRDMAARNYLAHDARDGTSPSARVDARGYAWGLVAENIAGGQTNVPEVVESWLRSPGHCANLMKPALREVGAACVRATRARYATYWTLVLATPLRPPP